jgi:cell division protein FtsB
MKTHRFAFALIAACSLAVIGCTSAPTDKSQSQFQQLQQQLKADEATLQQLQQQEQADQATLEQIQRELSELMKRRSSPCPDCPAERSLSPEASPERQRRAIKGDSKVGGKMSPDAAEEIQLDLPG